MKTLPMLMIATCAACGGGSPVADAGPGISKPLIQGAFAFDAGVVGESTQVSGGMPGDNLSIFVRSGCGGGPADLTLTISLYTHDHSKLSAGAITVEARSSGTAGNVFGNVDYRDDRGSPISLSAKSGTVTMDTVDFDSLSRNAGRFDVQLDLRDGGTSQLTGTFDGRYLCN